MLNPIKNLILALSIFLATVPLNAQAACTLANMAGTWRFFGVTGSPNFQGFGRGTAVISSNGVLNAASSSLILSNGQVFRFKSGKGQLTSTCKVTGTLVTTVGVTTTLVDGQMNSSKNVISGVYKRSDGDVGLINIIK